MSHNYQFKTVLKFPNIIKYNKWIRIDSPQAQVEALKYNPNLIKYLNNNITKEAIDFMRKSGNNYLLNKYISNKKLTQFSEN